MKHYESNLRCPTWGIIVIEYQPDDPNIPLELLAAYVRYMTNV